jgi:hypothetical protein
MSPLIGYIASDSTPEEKEKKEKKKRGEKKERL